MPIRRINEKLYTWASLADDQTQQQALQTASMPFVQPHLALMPDCHLGAGATVGSVIPTLGAIIPAAVGVDIGCGMMAIRTQLQVGDLPADRVAVRAAIEAAIPLSAGNANPTLYDDHTVELVGLLEAKADEQRVDPDRYLQHWRLQLGNTSRCSTGRR